MVNPVSTYRIQFNKEFTFQDLENIIPYLEQLGIGTIYSSPIFKAVPGSVHGYDVTQPDVINPEIGTDDELLRISAQLKEKNIKWLQDIVPNHMAYHQDNEWLMDVLEKGQLSLYTSYFDSSFSTDFFEGQIMAPFLGGPLEEVIAKQDLKIKVQNNKLALGYYDSYFPLNLRSYTTILEEIKEENDSAQELLQQLEEIHGVEDATIYHGRWQEIMMQFTSLLKNQQFNALIENGLEKLNSDKKFLKKIADEQVYRLCNWQETDKEINYRRFFTINGLICLNIHDEKGLQQHHRLVKRLIDKKVFDGLRVDHIDGLLEPKKYLDDLRNLIGLEKYIVVEKILEANETLPGNWPVQGTTGYDFLSLVNNLFTNKENEKQFDDLYKQVVNQEKGEAELIHENKRYILENHMRGELDNLTNLFSQIGISNQGEKNSEELTRKAIGEFLVYLPVYRFYGSNIPLTGEEALQVSQILDQIEADQNELQQPLKELREVFLIGFDDPEQEQKAINFYKRCMQFSGPLMAKGVEDTLMYSYNRFIAHNEVGDNPFHFGLTLKEFHAWMKQRQKEWPLALNATATHDTKRGEDARTRLNVLSDIPEEFKTAIQQLMSLEVKGNRIDNNDKYFINQAIIGHLPMPGVEDHGFLERLKSYVEKALREAKIHSNWTKPDRNYEENAKHYAAALLKEENFISIIKPVFDKVADHGIINSLSQSVLKFTCPGIPDVYQGTELWDLSFVDPDNRRKVDFQLRKTLAKQFEKSSEELVLQQLWEKRYEGGIKLWLTSKLSLLRKNDEIFWTKADYIPIATDGIYKDHILAFARKYKRKVALIVIPLHTAVICSEQQCEPNEIDWRDTSVAIPWKTEDELQLLDGSPFILRGKKALAKDLFRKFPIAVLNGNLSGTDRSAGILLSVTSLPSRFGIGDMGPEAKAFVDFLERAGQKYWQLLPINPTEEGQGYSPYSSTSSKAGNPVLISPELLFDDGLLEPSDLDIQVPQQAKADYKLAESIREDLLDKAYNTFKRQEEDKKEAFEQFCEKEKDWLDDYAMYVLLKSKNKQKPWYEWEDEYKYRKPSMVKSLEKDEPELVKIKWIQYIFFKEWIALKDYCKLKGISIIGDLPFYVSYDSADVWANREIFAIDENGVRSGLAGVPPDAFSADGQLWGMPVYNWEVLKEQGYKWWIKRIETNLELYDIIRIDHFRALVEYWEVPPGEETAKNGIWNQGPGAEFLEVMDKTLGKLPFLAEDLGDVDEKVFALRDQFKLPGMKVLQFAFGEEMPVSPHIPHNYSKNFIVYTGTHDNNTVRGWYRTDADELVKNTVQQYLARTITEEEIADIFIRMAYSSVAQVAILPIQDILGLDESARMNTPSQAQNNWTWRLLPNQVTQDVINKLQEYLWIYLRQ